MKAKSIKDVAKRAGVSISTASYALNDIPKVKQETKARILQAARELNFHPNSFARFLKRKKSETIGVFLIDINSPFYWEVIQGIEQEVSRRNYDFIIAKIHPGKSTAFTLISDRRVDGGIILGASFTENSFMEKLISTNVPLVLADRSPDTYSEKSENLSLMVLENEKGCRLALDHMVSRGLKKIGFVAGLPDSYDSQARESAYSSYLKEKNLPFDKDWIIEGNYQEEKAFSSMKYFLETHARESRPEAFFCANDQMAWGVIQAILQQGLRVPGDLAVMGFDDVKQASLSNIGLSTIHRDSQGMGLKAVESLFKMIEKQSFDKIITMPVSLIVRESC